ncbi:MAG: flagellar hook-associated protein FlgK [Oscillospiraceae bacterium]|nr:flagellar hook-associated protein FlgK [Oscillospiraceae bacterium]
MRSSFMGLEVSKRSIQLAQKAIDITNHNTNNAMTKGYTRQRIDQYAMRMVPGGLWQTPTAKMSLAAQGVSAFGISQIRDPYLDKRFRDLACYQGEYRKKADILSQVETTLDNIESAGLTNQLDELKRAMSIYATNAPDNAELSTIVRNQAYNLTVLLNTYHTDLNRMLELNVFEAGETVDYVNVLIQKITGLNAAILNEYKATEFGEVFRGESVSQYGPLELKDQQNLLIDELAYYADVHVTTNHDGTLNVTVGGQKVVSGTSYETLIMSNYESFDAMVLRVSGGEELRLKSGELKAYQDLVGGNGPYANFYQNSDYGIPYYISAINTFAQDFAWLMNSFNGATDIDSSRAMFGSLLDVYDDDGYLVERGIIDASTIRISEEWMNDATMIGQVQDPETGAWAFAPDLDGNNANNLVLAFEHSFKIGLGADFEGSIYEYTLFLSNRLGQGIDFQETQYTTSFTTTNELLNSRDAVSGVSDTEEGINLMTYQKWFNASARIMTSLDECLDLIINRMGRVGL